MKKLLTILFLGLFFIPSAYSLQVGEEITFVVAREMGPHTIKNTSTYRIGAHNEINDSFELILEEDGEEVERKWISSYEFPTTKQIDEFLLQCESTYFGRIEWVYLEGSSEKQKVCVTGITPPYVMPFPTTMPDGGDLFYVGHFPIFGILKIEGDLYATYLQDLKL